MLYFLKGIFYPLLHQKQLVKLITILFKLGVKLTKPRLSVNGPELFISGKSPTEWVCF